VVNLKATRILNYALVTIGWSITVATIALQTLYYRFLRFLIEGLVEENAAVLRPMDLILIFLVSLLAGAVIAEPSRIVLSFLGTLFTSGLIMYFCLTLPAIIGKTRSGLGVLLEMSAVNYVFTTLVFGPVILLLLGSIIGGILKERFVY